MRVSDVMSREVVIVDVDETVQEAAERMEVHSVGVLPVFDEGKLVGMLTDRDVAIRIAAPGFVPWSVRVREVMTPGIVACPPEMDLNDAVQRMQQQGVRRLVVLDPQGQLKGLLSIDDVLQLPEEQRPPLA